MTATKLWLNSLLFIAGVMVTGCGKSEPPPPPPPKITKGVYEKVSLALSKAKTLKQMDKILAKVKITSDDYNNCVLVYGTPRWQRKQTRDEMKKQGVPEDQWPPLDDPPAPK